MSARIFLSNENDYQGVRDEIELAIQRLSKGIAHRGVWTCSTVKNIQVGDIAYFKRVAYQPRGIFARGRIIMVPEEFQLRKLDNNLQDLSGAYLFGDYNPETGFFEQYSYPNTADELVVYYEWDTVVDYDTPLDTDILKNLPEYKAVQFDLRASGHTFIKSSEDILNSAWEKHSSQLAKRGRGAKLIDSYLRMGRQKANDTEYAKAIEYYTEVVDRSSLNREAFFERGLVYLELKKYDEAIQDFYRVIDIEPRYADAHWHLGLTYADLIGDNQKALEHFNEAASLFSLYNWQDRFLEAQEFIRLLSSEDDNLSIASQKNTHQSNGPDSNHSNEGSDNKDVIFNPLKQLQDVHKQLDDEDFFKLNSTKEAQKQISISIARRQGQSQFRQNLLNAYSYCCAITGCDAKEALEAAHILPYSKSENNHPSNGLLLRADLHTLFDLNLIVVDPSSLTVRLAPQIRDSVYAELEGRSLRLPEVVENKPNEDSLNWRWKQFNAIHVNDGYW